MSIRPYLLILVAAFAVTSTSSEEEKKLPIFYYDLDPNIITNYQKKTRARKLGYVTLDVQFQVSGEDNLELLDEHKALIENTVIDVISSQSEETIRDLEKRDALREQIKSKLAAALKEETGKEIVEQVLFTNFLYQ